MPSQEATFRRTAWLFTRGDSSVTMTVREEATGVALVVLGPGPASATYQFKDAAALSTFADVQEQKLRDAGFQLQAVAERRGTGDRRDVRPPIPERRRRR